jgi:hypothetical protein
MHTLAAGLRNFPRFGLCRRFTSSRPNATHFYGRKLFFSPNFLLGAEDLGNHSYRSIFAAELFYLVARTK